MILSLAPFAHWPKPKEYTTFLPYGHDGKIQLDFNTQHAVLFSTVFSVDQGHLSTSFTPSVEAVKVGDLYLRVKPPKVYSNATDASNAHPEKTSATFRKARMRMPLRGATKMGGKKRIPRD
jgi:hypothetical protein